jgi:hypothetical protein
VWLADAVLQAQPQIWQQLLQPQLRQHQSSRWAPACHLASAAPHMRCTLQLDMGTQPRRAVQHPCSTCWGPWAMTGPAVVPLQSSTAQQHCWQRSPIGMPGTWAQGLAQG